MKPYQGEIHNWYKLEIPKDKRKEYPKNLGYVIRGVPINGRFVNWMQTSLVIKHNKKTSVIETLNSRYKLVNEQV